MSSTKRAALPGGNSTEEGEGVEILRAGVDPQTNHTTPAGVVSIYDLLPYGADSGITGDQLAELAGISKRTLQRQIAKERANGWPILYGGFGGYYRPAKGEAGRAELIEYLSRMRRKVSAIIISSIGAQLELEVRDFLSKCEAEAEK